MGEAVYIIERESVKGEKGEKRRVSGESIIVFGV